MTLFPQMASLMVYLGLLHFCLPLFAAAKAAAAHQRIFSNPVSDSDFDYDIPSIHESAVQARRVLKLESIGTLSTVYPSDSGHDRADLMLENRPKGLGGIPVGLMDYFADCEPESGNPTILAVNIGTNFRNEAAGSNITLSMRWHSGSSHAFSPASLPRFSLIGYLENIPPSEVKQKGLSDCFTKYHPDAVVWLPGNPIHVTYWTRLVVQELYFIGGFGDRAYIGWIPVEEWRNIAQKEVESIRLPGETHAWGWKQWLLGAIEL
ncbi:MAG: hypothetical protein M1833_006250 [Piccolia ochrophora]|nr:MAG: hypothetical protein M1833_006250 [Piccolia ochrophora]